MSGASRSGSGFGLRDGCGTGYLDQGTRRDPGPDAVGGHLVGVEVALELRLRRPDPNAGRATFADESFPGDLALGDPLGHPARADVGEAGEIAF